MKPQESCVSPIRLGLTKAAKMLDKLGICKAYNDRGGINGPNCYRFGHKEASEKRWHWELNELISEARTRGTASDEAIRKVLSELENSGTERITRSKKSPTRSGLLKQFWEIVPQLESSLRLQLRGRTSRINMEKSTFGSLIKEAREKRIYTNVLMQEFSFVNEVRNQLLHSAEVLVPDDTLMRATSSAKALLNVVLRNANKNS
jgi:hypothetical protein